jgi:PAS domain S-box-containing protein
MAGIRDVFVIDLTKRQAARAIPKWRGEDFQAVVSKNADAMVVIDHEGLILYANPAAESLFNLPFAELIGVSLGFPLVLDEPVELQILRDHEDHITVEMRIVEIVWAGEPSYLLSFRDMTDRILAEQAINQSWDKLETMVDERTRELSEANTELKRISDVGESEDIYHTLFDKVNDAIFVMSLDGRFMDVNQVAVDCLGYSRDELLTMNPTDIDAPEHAASVAARIKEILRNGHALFESAHVRRDGSKIPVEISSGIIEYNGEPAVLSIARDITERKRTEESLKFTQFAMDQSGDSAIWLASDRKIVYVNETACTSLGYSRDELLSMHIWDIDHGYMPEKFFEFWQDIKRQGSLVKLESTHVDRNGKKLPVEITSRYIRYGDREYLITFDRDIAERKRAEEELRRSEASLVASQQIAHLGNWDWDLESGIIEWSDECYRVFGYIPGEIKPVTYDFFISRVHPDDRERMNDSAVASVKDKKPFSMDFRLVRKDGSIVYAHNDGKIRYDKDGEPVSIFGTVQDITVRKLAEEALRESEEKFREIVETAVEGIWLLDNDYRVVFVNSRLARILGYSPGEVVGCLAYEFADEYYVKIAKSVYSKRKSGLKGDADMKFRKKDGSEVWVRISSSPRFKDGAFDGVLEMLTDITNDKRTAIKMGWMASFPKLDPEPIIETARYGQISYSNPAADVMFPDLHDAGHDHPYLKGIETIFARMHRIGSVIEPREIWIGSACYEQSFSYHGETDSIRIYGRDITKRKMAEEALKHAEEFTHCTLDSLPMNITVLDGSGTIVFANRSWMKFGMDNDVSPVSSIGVGANYIEVCRKARGEHSDEAPKAMKGILSVLSGENGSFEMEYPCHSPDTKRWFTMRVTPICTGTFQGVIVIHTDITLRKLSEEALADEKARAELYLDLMGHDINNMNQVAMGYLELAQDVFKSNMPVKDADIDLISKSYDKLLDSSQLIKNVSKLQKARSGELKPHMVDACQTMMRMYARYSNMPGINVSFNIDLPHSCPVNADDLLYEVFENIVSNAIKHAGQKPIINIKFDTVLRDGGKYNLFIFEDNGQGVSDELKERIFNRMQRGDTKAKGSGLGLFLVKSLVDSYGGKVWIEDRVSGDHTQGARFVVMLPVIDN